MTIQIIPLSAVPSQRLGVTLAQRPCQINVYQRSTGLFIDLYVNGQPILTGVLCHDRVRLIRYAYLGFMGDLAFFDTQAANDPYYTGFASRYFLAYGSEADIAAIPQAVSLPAFTPFGYFLEAGTDLFLTVDGVNPLGVYMP